MRHPLRINDPLAGPIGSARALHRSPDTEPAAGRGTARRLGLLGLCALLGACAMHSTATQWNGRVGPDGEPVFYASSTKVGMNLLVAVPFLGDLDLDGQVDSMTEDLAERGGDRVRIVQGSTETYWYGFPPVTWVLTPVVTTLTAEYRPSDDEIRSVLRERLVRQHRKRPLAPDELERRVEQRYREVKGLPPEGESSGQAAVQAESLEQPQPPTTGEQAEPPQENGQEQTQGPEQAQEQDAMP
jgi:hypothetical protein